MKILAIDPGSEYSAWCLLDGGRVAMNGYELNGDVLTRIRTALFLDTVADVLAVEMIASYGMPVGREVFETCLWIGRYIEAWDHTGRPHRLVYRKDVKMHLCGVTKAKDANVRQAIIDQYGPGKDKAIGKKKNPGPLYGISGDEWSALAVALTAAA